MLTVVEVLRSTDIRLDSKFVTAKSSLLSPSISPISTIEELLPVVKSTLAAKEDALMLPVVEVLRSNDIVPEL